jgi:hypothetical protein
MEATGVYWMSLDDMLEQHGVWFIREKFSR